MWVKGRTSKDIKDQKTWKICDFVLIGHESNHYLALLLTNSLRDVVETCLM